MGTGFVETLHGSVGRSINKSESGSKQSFEPDSNIKDYFFEILYNFPLSVTA